MDRVERGVEVEQRRGTALLFCTDLMFGVQLQNMARHAGLQPVTLRPGAELPDGDVLVVDLAARGDWVGVIREGRARGMRVVAFGPHMDAEARRKAKEAGAGRVLANSNLARDLPLIFKEIAEWAR
jgi:hypothetical protein